MDAVLNWLWQGGVVAVAMSAMLVALRRARANVRYMVCWGAAMVVAGLPVVPSLRFAARVDLVALPYNDAIVALPHAWWTSTNVLLLAMALWAGFHVLQFVAGISVIRRARRRSRPFPAHLELLMPHWRRLRYQGRQARLVLSTSVTRAAVFGWGSPVIAVAPALVRRLDPEDLDRVLIHEWAHVQRRDDLVSVLQIVVRIVAGWHPAVWWIERRLDVEREIACDETTVDITGSAKSYAECLMKLSSMKGASQRVQMAPAVLASSGLRARVMKIVSPDRPIAPVWSRTLAAAILLVLCVLSAAVGRVTLVEAATLAAPVISAATRTLIAAPDQPVAMAQSATTSTKAQRASVRGPARSSSPQQPTPAKPSPPEPPAPQSTDTRESHEAEPIPGVDTADPTRATEPEQQSPSNAAIEARSAPAPPPSPPNVTTQTESPWSAAAAGGAAIGQKSKSAGLATAGAFKRFASRIAGSF